MGRVNGKMNAMIYKFLFFFFSYLEKKYSLFENGDHYISSYIIVGFTMAVNLFVIADVVCILFLQSTVVAEIINNSMLFVGFAMIAISYLYFRKNNRRDTIYEEIGRFPVRKKITYGVYCLLYMAFSYGLWFVCNDIMCVLKTGYGLTYAEKIVHALNLKYWE